MTDKIFEPAGIEQHQELPILGLPKPSGPSLTSPALSRLNEIVLTALGGVQRDWLRGIEQQKPVGEAGDDFSNRAAERLDHMELRRQLNIEALLQRAVRNLPERIEDGVIDPDWAARFFTAVADVSDSTLARLWARLLVMEVRRVGAVPPLVLHRLPMLSKEVLSLFHRFAAFAVNNFVVRLATEFFEARDITADNILLMEEYGLVRTNRDLNRVFSSQLKERFSTNLLYTDKALRVTHEDPDKTLTLGCYRLTEFGTALSRALLEEGEIRSDTEYLVELVRTIQKQGFQVSQADILEREDEQIVSKHTRFCELVVLGR